LGKAQQEFPQIYPRAGWVEHDPHDIYGSQVGVIVEALIRANVSAADIAAIGITNQRETTFVWDKNTGKPVYNAIVWQCRRTADYCEQLKKQGLSDMIYEKTGLVLDAYFSATKLKWILDNVEGARIRAEKGELLFGTVDTWLIWKLTEGRVHVTDYTNASRTMLYDIHNLCWDDHCSARWIRILCGSCRAEKYSPPTIRMPAERCCLTFIRRNGTANCLSCSAFPKVCCLRFILRDIITA